MRRSRIFWMVVLAAGGFVGPGRAAPTTEAPTFNSDIRPLLADKCYACHGPDSGTREADLRLDTEEGSHQSVVIPGDADHSEVIVRVTSDDPEVRMPPPASKKPPLSSDEVERLKKWINAGAKYEAHWAYIPPKKADVPSVEQAAWPRNGIDRYLLAALEARGIGPGPEADRVTIIRRLYFDLVGLPPTPAQVDAFVSDNRPDAYEQLVDELLASPRFGERMATWWFDLVRYADTVGYHGDQDHHIAPYRDYVIKSFNDNLTFDQFTIEQLAGDLLPNPTMWQLVATGYNRVLQTTHEGGAQDTEYRAIMLADRVRNYSETWLAGSMGCAQCHDHKFDPYTMDDFYSLQAFFADVDHYGSFQSIARNEIPTQRPPEILAWTLPVYEKLSEVDKKVAEAEKELTGRIGEDWKKKLAELTELRQQRVELQGQFVPTMITQALETPREIRILNRGNWMDKTGPVVQPHVPHFLRQIDSAGRRANRLDLAKWTVSRDNPLAARVVVNRLWKLYFGTGLSKLLIDIGARGEVPPNQALLDWLAIDFMEHGWDIKRAIRQMVTTSAYRQSSLPRPEVDALDPENRLLAHQSRYRLEAEQIRDNALAVSGLLVQKLGGEITKPYQPPKYYAALNFPERDYAASTGADQFRRAVYTHWQRQYLLPFLLAFDAPTREECTAQRPISSTPTAALALLNDPSFVEAARALAAKVLAEAPSDDESRIRWAWRQVLGREALPAESAVLAKLLSKHRAQYTADRKAAEAILTVGISARPEKMDPAELAAWTSVSRVLLNLNETITRN